MNTKPKSIYQIITNQFFFVKNILDILFVKYVDVFCCICTIKKDQNHRFDY